MHLFLWLLLVDFVLVWSLLAATKPSLGSCAFVVLPQFIVIEGVRTLVLAQSTLALQVVAVDEETDDCIDERIDQDEGRNDETPVRHHLFVVRLDTDLRK